MRSQDHATPITAVTSGQLEKLIARVEAASGERGIAMLALDNAIYRALRQRGDVDFYTSSLDAALALVERVAPDGYRDHFRLTKHVGLWTVAMWPDWTEHNAPTPALALLLALLRALQAQASADGTHDGASPKNTEASQ